MELSEYWRFIDGAAEGSRLRVPYAPGGIIGIGLPYWSLGGLPPILG